MSVAWVLSLEELVEFFDARDQFLGEGNSALHPNMAEGFRRLQASPHHEAVRVCSFFPNGPPESNKEARRVFLEQGEDPVARCYAGLVIYSAVDLRAAAELGHPHAQAALCAFVDKRHRFVLAKRSAKGGDRSGWLWLGLCRQNGHGCEKNPVKARAAFRTSALLGCAEGIRYYAQGSMLHSTPERFLWLGEASRKDGDYRALMKEAASQLRRFDEGMGRAPVLMTIGRVLRGAEHHIEQYDRKTAARAVRLYEDCIARAQAAVVCWILCARRWGFYRDVSLIVARMVWEGRDAFLPAPESESNKEQEDDGADGTEEANE